jgi:hypothetical protein
MESFYRILKRELVDDAGFRTRDQLVLNSSC